MPVNEALYTSVDQTEVDNGLKRDVVAMTWCYPTHTGNALSSFVGGVGEWP